MSIDHLLASDARLEKVAGGFTWLEGPEADGTTVEISTDAEYTNGRTLGRDGAVIECSHGRRAVQIDRAASEPGAPYAPEILVDRFGDARLNSPNDVVEKSDGTIW